MQALARPLSGLEASGSRSLSARGSAPVSLLPRPVSSRRCSHVARVAAPAEGPTVVVKQARGRWESSSELVLSPPDTAWAPVGHAQPHARAHGSGSGPRPFRGDGGACPASGLGALGQALGNSGRLTARAADARLTRTALSHPPLRAQLVDLLKPVDKCWQCQDFMPDPSSPTFLDEARALCLSPVRAVPEPSVAPDSGAAEAEQHDSG